jgi:hypothetical protein
MTRITDDTFYTARIATETTVHDERTDAISHLRENADGIDPDGDDVSIVEVSIDGDDWQIKELPWQQIALELLQGGDGA